MGILEEGSTRKYSIHMRIQFLQLPIIQSEVYMIWYLCYGKTCKLFFFSLPSRFGNLIKVYLVAGKNVAYAKFADRASASDAITALHGKIVNGVRLKVRLADSLTEESNKRQRTY